MMFGLITKKEAHKREMEAFRLGMMLGRSLGKLHEATKRLPDPAAVALVEEAQKIVEENKDGHSNGA